MGLFDGLRQQASAQRQQWLQQLYATLPPGAPQVYVDDIPVRGPAEVAIAWYVGTVGLRSEDVYASFRCRVTT